MHQIVQYRLGSIDGNSKANAGALFHATSENHGVNADHLAARVQQRTAGVAGVDSGVSLDGFIDKSALSPHRANGTDDATCHGAAETKRIPDGKDLLADNKIFGIADLGLRNRLAGNLYHRQIMRRVHSNDLGFVLLLVAGGHLYLARTFYDVIVGENVAFSVNHKA